MSQAVLMALHTAVLGYWLGSDLVINSEYRFIVHRHDLPVGARQELTDHLMKVDQHVRYALVLQAALGTMLLAGLGLLPPGLGLVALFAGLGWLGLVEVTHRTRKTPLGNRLALLDRMVRYALALTLLALAATQIDWPLWLRVKVGLFAGVIGCGLLIRFQLIRHFAVWSDVLAQGSTAEREASLRATYRRATSILAGLWLQVFAIAALAVLRPF